MSFPAAPTDAPRARSCARGGRGRRSPRRRGGHARRRDRRGAPQRDARLGRPDRPCRNGGHPRGGGRARHLAARRLHLVGDARALRDVRRGDFAGADQGAPLRRRRPEGRRGGPRRREFSRSRPAIIARTCSEGSARTKPPSFCAPSSPSAASPCRASAGFRPGGSRLSGFRWFPDCRAAPSRQGPSMRSARGRPRGWRDKKRPPQRACPTAPG